MPTDQQLDALRTPLLNGSALADAARKAGVSDAALSAWLADPDVEERIEGWIAEGRLENHALVKRAAIGHPQNITTTVEYSDAQGRRTGSRKTTVERTVRDWRAATWLEANYRGDRRRLHTVRPSGLTPQVHRILIDSFRTNPHMEPAAAAARIGYSTLKSWFARGRGYREFLEHGDLGDADVGTRRLYHAGASLWATGSPVDRQAALSALALVEDRTRRPEDEPYLDLILDVEQASAHLEYELTESVLRHAQTDGRLALRALQVLYRDRYGDRVELTGRTGGPIEVDLEATKADALDALERVEQARQRAGT